jgi:phosphoribosyl-dephospho-CoA transferase
MAPPDLPRHTLVQLASEASWLTMPGSSSPCLRKWFAAGRPAMVARRHGDEPADFVRLGVALPGKRRLSLAVHPSRIAHSRAPLSLPEVMKACPAEWAASLQLLNSLTLRTQLQPGVYGSFAWQALTRECYVDESSDIDLLWAPASAAEVDTVITVLTEWERCTQRRADGEVLMPNGGAVCWRELAGASRHVLVKSQSTVALRSRADVLAQFA